MENLFTPEDFNFIRNYCPRISFTFYREGCMMRGKNNTFTYYQGHTHMEFVCEVDPESVPCDFDNNHNIYVSERARLIDTLDHMPADSLASSLWHNDPGPNCRSDMFVYPDRRRHSWDPVFMHYEGIASTCIPELSPYIGFFDEKAEAIRYCHNSYSDFRYVSLVPTVTLNPSEINIKEFILDECKKVKECFNETCSFYESQIAVMRNKVQKWQQGGYSKEYTRKYNVRKKFTMMEYLLERIDSLH